MTLFRERKLRPTHLLDMRLMNASLLDRLNPAEQELVTEAFATLEARQLVTMSEAMGHPALTLTQQGYDYLYPQSEEQATMQAEKAVLGRFKATLAGQGHGLPWRFLFSELEKRLTAKEMDSVEAAIAHLVAQGLLEDTTIHQRVLTLTGAGADQLYYSEK